MMYDNDFMSSNDATVAAATVFAFMFALLIGLIFYVFKSIVVMQTLKYMGYPSPWHIWIPFLGSYAMARVCIDSDGQVRCFGREIDGELFSFWWVLQILVNFIPAIGTFANVVITWGFYYVFLSKTLSRLEGVSEQDVNGKAVIGSIVNIVGLIFLLIDNNNVKNNYTNAYGNISTTSQCNGFGYQEHVGGYNPQDWEQSYDSEDIDR